VSIFLRSFVPAVLCCRAQNAWVDIVALQAQVSATEEHGKEAKATDTNLEQHVEFLEVWLRATCSFALMGPHKLVNCCLQKHNFCAEAYLPAGSVLLPSMRVSLASRASQDRV